MPDEAPGQSQDTPAESQVSGPGEGTPAESQDDSGSPADDNWQERYTEAQAWGTRASQEASQYRQIIDLARQGDPEALAFLGVELDEDDDVDDEGYEEGDDDNEPMTRADFERYLRDQQATQQAAEQEQRQLNEDADYIRNGIAEFEKDKGELSEAEYEAVIDLAVSRIDNSGWPDVAGALERVTGLKDTVISNYVANKRKAPQPPAGSSASHQPNLDNAEERRQWMADQLAARGE